MGADLVGRRASTNNIYLNFPASRRRCSLARYNALRALFREFAHAYHAEDRRAKLAKLIEIEGYSSIEELVQAVLSDSVSPAICMNEGCDFTCEMEPDQDAGYCEECHTNSMHSALVLAELI